MLRPLLQIAARKRKKRLERRKYLTETVQARWTWQRRLNESNSHYKIEKMTRLQSRTCPPQSPSSPTASSNCEYKF